ncbi:peptide deformylase [Methylocystis bryophila]|uniref:Peptide deformylase n=1 Tax=Methylocystis bryophila TaxID=655015 RepID=A0A1W6MUV4_9HYPH|nr:peptide deformylase [Methylocystis bryophila]ARN81374.1 peptide deformylase [Methylocystis bryophila]BDV37362.1 peptide deformylase [Methylocystis bryophila]
MALLPILTLPDPRLRLISQPVERVDAAILKLLDDMLETMYEAPGVGLAAIQVGHAKRIVTIDITKKEEEPRAPLFLINPQIVWASEELSTYNEGCLSVPEYFEDVQRPARVRLRHIDRQGVEQEIEAEGLLATVVQHELDHLEGGLFIDHLSRLKRERVVKKFTKAARHEARAVERQPEDA